jgi:hypothetical protein
MSAGTSNAAFRTLDDAGKLRDNDVNPYYLEGLKHRVSVARVGGKLFATVTRCQGVCSRARP